MALDRESLEKAYRDYFQQVSKSKEAISIREGAENFLLPYYTYTIRAEDLLGHRPGNLHFTTARNVLIRRLEEQQGIEGIIQALSAYWREVEFGVVDRSGLDPEDEIPITPASFVVWYNPLILEKLPSMTASIEEAAEHISGVLHEFTQSILLFEGLPPYPGQDLLPTPEEFEDRPPSVWPPADLIPIE